MKTSGGSGKNIPEQAFKLVESYGIEYFKDLRHTAFIKVPRSIKVVKVHMDDLDEATIMDEQVLLPINNSANENNYNGYYLINDRKYFYL